MKGHLKGHAGELCPHGPCPVGLEEGAEGEGGVFGVCLGGAGGGLQEMAAGEIGGVDFGAQVGRDQPAAGAGVDLVPGEAAGFAGGVADAGAGETVMRVGQP